MRIRGGQEVESRSACAEAALVTAERGAKEEPGVTSGGTERGGSCASGTAFRG